MYMSAWRGRFAMFAACIGVALTGTAAAQNRPGTEFTVVYGTVDRVDQVAVGSDGIPKGVGTGAVIGGLAGSYNSSHGHQVRDAAAGALVGALLTAAIKQHQNKGHTAYQYTVGLVNGGNISVVIEDGSIRQGDCVAVEQGPSANVRRVSNVYCQNAGHAGLSGPEVSAKKMEDAADCHAAKDLAMRARSEQEIDVALKKVRIFCES